MIVQRAPDQVASWSIAFFERGRFRGERFVPGRFKHVLAFGYSEPCRTWVVLNVTFARTEVFVLPDGPWGLAALAEWIEGAAVLAMPTRRHADTTLRGHFLRPLSCVSAVAHLVGIRCGVTPTSLWRSCLRNGAVIVQDGKQPEPRALCAAVGAGP